MVDGQAKNRMAKIAIALGVIGIMLALVGLY
jgi:hypothetical protein